MESPISISILEVLGWGRLSSAKIPSFKSDRGQTHDSTVETSLLCFDKREALQTYKLHPWQEKKKRIHFTRSLLRCLKEKPLSKILNVAKNGKKH